MAFDWPRFLRQHNIEYVTRGPNTPRGEISIKCPLCGNADPSQHMCIALNGRGWHCWRLPQLHKGKDRAKLIKLLLKCDMKTARELAGYSTKDIPSDEVAEDKWQKWQREVLAKDSVIKPKSLQLLKEFKPLTRTSVFTSAFFDYLLARGYRKKQLNWLIEAYNIHYATKGPFAYRVILPIYDDRGKLLTWTGRTIVDDEVRYKTLSVTPNPKLGLPAALCATSETLFGLDVLWSCPNPKVLLICEGPFDAMWLTVFGRSFGVYATSLFGLNFSQRQMGLLIDLQPRFPRQKVFLDSAAKYQAFRMSQNGMDLGIERLSPDVKDPAVLTPAAVVDLCLSLVE